MKHFWFYFRNRINCFMMWIYNDMFKDPDLAVPTPPTPPPEAGGAERHENVCWKSPLVSLFFLCGFQIKLSFLFFLQAARRLEWRLSWRPFSGDLQKPPVLPFHPLSGASHVTPQVYLRLPDRTGLGGRTSKGRSVGRVWISNGRRPDLDVRKSHSQTTSPSQSRLCWPKTWRVLLVGGATAIWL